MRDLSSAIKDTINSPVDAAVFTIEATIQQWKNGYKAPHHTSFLIRGLEAAHLDILFTLLVPIVVFLFGVIFIIFGIFFHQRRHRKLRLTNKDKNDASLP